MDKTRKCSVCGKHKTIPEFQKGRWKCKVCTWKDENSYNVLNGWNEYEYDVVLDNILNKKIKYINELSNILNKTIGDLVMVLTTELTIFNKPMNILYNCDYCNKEIMVKPCKYKFNNNMYCSHKCYGLYKKENTPTGKNNPDYNRVLTECTNCNVKIEVIPWHYNKRNKHGDNHNFCSQKCYWEYRSKYYVKEKSTMYNFKFTPEQLDKLRINTVKLYEDGVFNRETKPQKVINDVLQKLNIEFIREKGFKYYAVDNYLNEFNLIIEIMGDYFHSNPNKFKLERLNKMQQKGIKRDKSKRTYIFKYYNIKILYLWEMDINSNIDLCVALILQYIKNNGILENYNSFNYYLDENKKLCLKNKIINPYYEISN